MVAMGETLLMLGDVDEAERTYRKALDQDRTALAPYLQLYKLYVSKQRMDDAETILRRAIATHPDNYGLQVQLAAHFVATKNRWEMAKALDSLKTHFKEYPDAFNRAGEFYAQLGDNDRAIREYQEGMTRDSLHKLDYQKRVIDALMRKGDNASAFEKNREILKANAKDVDARALDANFLLEKGQTDAAIAELRAVVASKPDNFVSLSILGRAYYAKKELGLSAQQFEEVLKVRPDYMPARLALAQIALLRHDPDTALTWAQTGLKMDPRSADSAFLEASAYADKGELDKARPLLETLVKDNPRKADPLAALASLEMREKRYKEAEELFRRAYEAEPSNLRGLLGMAEVYARQNDPAGAVQVIAAEVKKQPRRPDLVRALADVEMKNRQYDKAIADYQSVVDQYRAAPLEEAQIIERMGESYEIKGDLQKSLDSYRRARQLAPSNTLYIRRIADLLDRQGKSEEAVAAYRDAMKIDPTNAIVMNNLAFAISRSGQNLDEALTLAQRAKQQLPNLDDASDTIGWIYVRKNLSDSAVEIFRNLTAKVKNNSTYHYHYGVALAQKGDKANALKELRVALQNNPTKSEEAQIKELVQKLS
jgi:tetratricopeptide (TPR) repeat protein